MLLFCDGFDKYGPTGQTTPTVQSLLTAGEWNSTSNAMAIVAGLSAIGYALNLSGTAAQVFKTLTTSYARLIGGVRISPITFASGQFGIALRKGGTPQVSIIITSGGAVQLVTGTMISGTVLATGGSLSANSVHYLEWDITIGAAGAYQVWLDGASLFSGTGNTRGDGANNNADTLLLGQTNTVGSPSVTFDDLYLFDSTGAQNNAALLTNPIVETAFPSGDQQTQWSNGATVIGNDNSATGSSNAPGANFLFLRTFTPQVNMTLNSVSCRPAATSGAANFKPVVYGPVPAIGAHRYWRLFGNTSVTFVAACEFQFRSTAGTPLLFSGGTASASSVNGGNVAANGADNNTATSWEATGATGQWWQYDYGLGNTFTPAEITMQAPPSGFGAITSFAPFTNCDLQYSDDNVNFFTVANLVGAVWSSNLQVQTFTLSSRPTVAGSPGSALIALGNQVTGTITGNTLTATFASGQSLTGGTQYAIGYITDTSVALSEQDTSTTGLKLANTYSSNAPTVLPTCTTGQNDWQIWGNCTGSTVNWPSLSNNPPIDDIAYAFSSTVSQEDHQSFPNLQNNPASIYAVSYKARVKRSDSGTRTVDVRCVSSGVNSPGNASGFTPGSSFNWVDTAFETDPFTGLPWSGAACNAAVAGAKIAS